MIENGIRIVGDLARLELQPGDRLVLTSRDRLSLEHAERLRDWVERAWSGEPDPPKVLILDAGMSLGAVAPPSRALADIAAERKRQVEVKGWDAAHDDAHGDGAMARAAAAYALAAVKQCIGLIDQLWPWAKAWWKPKDARRDLVRAGALIVAELERLDRAAAREATQP